MCILLFIRSILSNWCYSIFHKIPKILITKNNIHLLTLIFIILIIQDGEICRKIFVRMIHRDSMCPKDRTVNTLDTRYWENFNLEVNRINFDEQGSIFFNDHVSCSSPFTQVKQPLIYCKMIIHYTENERRRQNN